MGVSDKKNHGQSLFFNYVDNFCAARLAPRGKKIIWMNTMCTFARVVDATGDKNHDSFLTPGGKKVAHHKSKLNKGIQTKADQV